MKTEEQNIKMDVETIEASDFSVFAKEFNENSYILSTKFDLSRASIQRSEEVFLDKLLRDGFEGEITLTGKFISDLGDNIFVIYDSINIDNDEAYSMLVALENN